MSLVKGNGAGDQSTGFYNDVIDQSLRFDDGDSPRLSKSFGSGGSRTTFTFATWVKRATISTDMLFFHSFGPTGFGIEGFVGFTTQNLLSFQFDYNSGNPRRLVSNRLFRDVTNWYHICCVADSSNSTSGDRLRMYINGVRETDFYDADYPSSGQNGTLNQAYSHYISGRTNNTSFFDGNLAEVNFLDGVAVTDTNGILDEFIEIKNGVCIPKSISGLSYGTTGFRFTFSDRSSASALGTDTSGNSINFSVSGLADIDQSQDTPEVNMATLNSLAGSTQQVFSAGNLQTTASSSATNFASARSTIGVTSGKFYAEFRLDVIQSGTGGQDNGVHVGVGTKEYPRDNSNHNGADTGTTTIYLDNSSSSNRGIIVDGSFVDTGQALNSAGDIIGIELNADDNEVTFYKNGTKIGNTRGITIIDGGEIYFYTYVRDQTANTRVTANFGQDGSFNNQRGFGTNSDDNGIGQFVYAPSSGYLALCCANLPAVTIGPDNSTQADDHFNTVLYIGNGGSLNVTGVGFAPDWVILKGRDFVSNTRTSDSSRTAGKGLQFNSTGAEDTSSTYYVSAFGSDGFSLNSGAGDVNQNTNTFVSHNWHANAGTTSSNSTGDITSTVQVNSEAGFSIILYTGFGEAVKTVGHGLSQAPEMIIFKCRGTAGNWFVYHHKQGNTGYTYPNLTTAFTGDSNFLNNTTPSSTLITLGPSSAANAESQTFVAYAFHGVEGYSKFGSYEMNYNSDGPFVYLGFRPAFVMTKPIDQAGSWSVYDNTRDPINDGDANMSQWDGITAESGFAASAIDFLSNGFKLRQAGDGYSNIASNTAIYMAFAETPFKFSNAR